MGSGSTQNTYQLMILLAERLQVSPLEKATASRQIWCMGTENDHSLAESSQSEEQPVSPGQESLELTPDELN